MTREQLQQIRDALEHSSPFNVQWHTAKKEALDILDRELAAPEQEPFCYVNVNAQGDVTRTIKREDKWCKTPLYRHPAPQSRPVARVTGYYGGNCVIEPLDGKSVFPAGMAVYSAPPAAKPWVGLTQDELDKITDDVIGWNSCCGWEDDYAREIEAALKAKNTGEQA